MRSTVASHRKQLANTRRALTKVKAERRRLDRLAMRETAKVQRLERELDEARGAKQLLDRAVADTGAEIGRIEVEIDEIKRAIRDARRR